MENEIKVGDVVFLKSDGPNMTIENIGEYNLQLKLIVLGLSKEKKSDVFALEALVLFKTKKGRGYN